MKYLPLLFLVACCTAASTEPTPGHPTLRSKCELVDDDLYVYRCRFQGAVCFVTDVAMMNGSRGISCIPEGGL